jgi:murein DD-endopeptidase MepM/ murein hydrolase activator NlpD
MIRFSSLAFVLGVLGCLSSCGDTVDPLDGMTFQDFSCKAPDESLFVLPYTVGESYKVSQGNCGSTNHIGDLRYGFDFEMPVGTIVRAAMTGIVNAVQEDYSDGDRQFGQENFITIQHDNGTYGRYLHLTKDGALVEPGQVVSRGTPIGLSGNTGFSMAPHLHFDVVRCRSTCNDIETLPVGFLNADIPVPIEAMFYLAKPF